MRNNNKANSVAVVVPQSHQTPAKLETIDPWGQGQMALDFVEANSVAVIPHSEEAYLAFEQDINTQSPAKESIEDAWLVMVNQAIEDGLECRNWESSTLAYNCESSCKACAN
jgi:hypothetical protein